MTYNTLLDTLVTVLSQFDAGSAASEDINFFTAILSAITSQPLILNLTLSTKSLRNAHKIVNSVLADGIATITISEEALTSLFDVSTSAFEALHHKHCLLTSDTTQALYSKSIDLMQQIDRANTKRIAKDPQSSKIMESDHVSMHTDVVTLKVLNEQQTSISQQDELPAFMLSYDNNNDADVRNDLNEVVVDVQAVLC